MSGFAIAATVAALRPLRPFTAAIVFVFVSFFALMAPYLILPRHFDFYAMNFVPILAFSVAPVMMIACSERIRPAAVRTLVAWALIVAVMATLYWVDYRPRYNSLYWIRHIREMAKRQLDEVQRAGDLGLRACCICAGDWCNGPRPVPGWVCRLSRREGWAAGFAGRS